MKNPDQKLFLPKGAYYKLLGSGLVIMTGVLIFGIKYLVTPKESPSAPPAAAQADVFTPRPESLPAVGGTYPARTAAKQGTSLQMLKEANENLSSVSASKQAGSASQAGSPPPRHNNPPDISGYMKQAMPGITPPSGSGAGAPSGGNSGWGAAAPAVPGGNSISGDAAVTAAVPAYAPRLQTQTASSKKSGTAKFSGAGRAANFTSNLKMKSPSGFQQGTERNSGVSAEAAAIALAGASDRQQSSGFLQSQALPETAGGARGSDSTSGGGQAQAKEPPKPVMYIWPRSLDHGRRYIGESSVRKCIIMNIGDADLKIGKITNRNPNGYEKTPFTLENDACAETTIKPKGTCTFHVRFAPNKKKIYSPATTRATDTYHSEFEVASNDADMQGYENVLDVMGTRSASKSNHTAVSKDVGFGIIPAGYQLGDTVKVAANRAWRKIKLVKSNLPDSVVISNDTCTGKSSITSCSFTLTFKPEDKSNKNYASDDYGKYLASDTSTGEKHIVSPWPRPPLILERPVPALIDGSISVVADVRTDSSGDSGGSTIRRNITVDVIRVRAESSADYPVYGIVRMGQYYTMK